MNLENISMAELQIKVLGTGCTKCSTLEKMTKQAVDELNINASIEKIDDIQKIMEYGIMATPGLVINGTVVLSGKLPKADELKNIVLENASDNS